MKTLKIPFTCFKGDFESHLKELQRIQTSIYHVAYNRASEGLCEIEIRSICRTLFPEIDSWVVQSAIKKGMGQFKADWELARNKNREFSGKRIFGGKKSFSSTISNIVNESYPDPIAASMEIARRGIESRVVKGSLKFYPKLVLKEVLERRWKDVLFPDFKTWIELHGFLKSTRMKYRVPIPRMEMFSPFSNVTSKVHVFVPI